MSDTPPSYSTVEDVIGNTPLVRLVRIPGADNEARGTVILGKLEGNNPAGSVKDRPALSMIRRAEERGEIKPGDTLIEATSGNTGIALAMAAAIKGYRMILMAGFFSLRKRETPVMVPVVPMALTKCVILPPVCSHSSGPVVS